MIMFASRTEAIVRMRADHSLRSQARARLTWVDSRLQRTQPGDSFPVTGPWSFRETCEHHYEWIVIDDRWLQCSRCWWCKPRLGRPPSLERLPAILKGRVLPPLSGKVDLHKLYANAGFVLDDDRGSVLSIVRVRVVQYSSHAEPNIRRCGVEVRFNEYGWAEAATFQETALYRLCEVVAKAAPRRPRALWLAIQAAYSRGWRKPWQRQ